MPAWSETYDAIVLDIDWLTRNLLNLEHVFEKAYLRRGVR